MEILDSYRVDIKAMPTDDETYQWQVDDDFFKAVEGSEIQQGRLNVKLRVKRISEVCELTFRLSGEVMVPCDRCLELMPVSVNAEYTVRAKWGEEYEDDGEILTVPEADGALNVAWNIYEFAALEIPIRHVHPDGQCGAQESLLTVENKAEEQSIDPRWEKLRQLKGQ